MINNDTPFHFNYGYTPVENVNANVKCLTTRVWGFPRFWHLVYIHVINKYKHFIIVPWISISIQCEQLVFYTGGWLLFVISYNKMGIFRYLFPACAVYNNSVLPSSLAFHNDHSIISLPRVSDLWSPSARSAKVPHSSWWLIQCVDICKNWLGSFNDISTHCSYFTTQSYLYLITNKYVFVVFWHTPREFPILTCQEHSCWS